MLLISDYDPAWPDLCSQEVERLRPIFGEEAAFEHVGSTSVPGLAAKPVLDILVGLRGVDLTREQEAALRAAGYVSRRRSSAGRRYFRKGSPRTHYLHVVERDGQWWRRYLRFRDLLREYPDEAAAYESVKRRVAAGGSGSYARAKASFIKDALRRPH